MPDIQEGQVWTVPRTAVKPSILCPYIYRWGGSWWIPRPFIGFVIGFTALYLMYDHGRILTGASWINLIQCSCNDCSCDVVELPCALLKEYFDVFWPWWQFHTIHARAILTHFNVVLHSFTPLNWQKSGFEFYPLGRLPDESWWFFPCVPKAMDRWNLQNGKKGNHCMQLLSVDMF